MSLIVFVSNTHFLPPSAFGALATAIVLVELVRQLVFLPVGHSVNSQQHVSDSDYTIAFIITLTVSLLVGALLLLCYPYLDGIFPGAQLSKLVPFMAASTVIIGLSTVYEAILVRQLKFRSLAIRSIISVAVSGATGLYLAMNGYGIWSLVWQQLLQQGLSLATIVLLTKWRPKFEFHIQDFKRITQFAGHVSLNGLIGFIGYQADTMAIAYFLGPRSTGLFNSAKRIGTALNQVILKPLERVALPALVQFSDDLGRLRTAYLRALGITALGTAPVFFGVAVISDDIVSLLLGENWSGVAPVLSALAMSFFCSTIVQYNVAVVMVARKPKLQSIINLIFVASSLGLMLISVQYGIIGVAVGVVIRSALMLPIQTLLATKIVKCSLYGVLRVLAPAVTASTIMALGVWIISLEVTFSSIIVGMTIKILLAAMTYTATLLLFFRKDVFNLVKGADVH